MAERIEGGNLYFFYKPKVQDNKIQSLDDIDRFFMVMEREDKNLYRSVSLAQKKMPEIAGKEGGPSEKEWALVDYVTQRSDDLRDVVLTRSALPEGEKTLPARPVGVAKYQLVRDQHATYLAYSLEAPDDLGQAQETFNILYEAAYTFKVKNPEYREEGFPGVEQNPAYPEDIEGLFDENLIVLKNNRLINYIRTQILLEGAHRRDVEDTLDIEFAKESAQRAVDRLYGTLHIMDDKHPKVALIAGRWPGIQAA